MFGLSLIMTDVDESGPAWSCGIRPGRNYNLCDTLWFNCVLIL